MYVQKRRHVGSAVNCTPNISAGGRFEVDERSGVVRTRGKEPFQLDMEYVLYVKAEDQNGREGRKYQSTPEERLSIVGGKRPPQFYMPSYEAEIPESQRKDSDIISVKAKSFADRDIRYTLKANNGQGAGTFNIGPSSGIVNLAKELDFEDLRQQHIYQVRKKYESRYFFENNLHDV